MTPRDGPGAGEPDGPEPGGLESRGCPVERLLRRFSCTAPKDAADRLLAGLTPERVSGELYRAELVCIAKKALWLSIFLAVFGLTTLVGFLHGRARPHGLRSGTASGGHAPPALADAGQATLEVEAQRFVNPFTPSPGGR